MGAVLVLAAPATQAGLVIRRPVVVLPGAPRFVSPPTPCGQTFLTPVGQRLQFPVVADDRQPDQQVMLQLSTDPNPASPGPRFDPPVTPANPVQTQVVWTPTQQDGGVGAFRITLVATDSTGARRKCAVFVTVVLGPQPPLSLLEKDVVRVSLRVQQAGALQGAREPGARPGQPHRAGAATATFFLGPTQTPLPGPGALVRVEHETRVLETEAASGGVFVSGVVFKTIVWQLDPSPEPVEVRVELPFSGFVPVDDARPGDTVTVTEAAVIASKQEVVGP
ncbi:MAG TPA: DUF3794 domain-containing protein [Limnochordales bacterium]